MKSPFRSIRQSLFNEGKLLRYIGYAIGEIALIIIGILFALKINNMNEDRKAQVEFDEYIVQLKEDVRESVAQARAASESLRNTSIESGFILEFLKRSESNSEELDTFKRRLRSLNYFREPQIKIGLLGEILEGKKEMISRDKELARLVNNMVGEVNRWHAIMDTIKDRLKPHWFTISQYRVLPIAEIPSSDFEFDLERMKSSTEFRYAVQSILQHKITIGSFSDRIAKILEEFLTVLEEYE